LGASACAGVAEEFDHTRSNDRSGVARRGRIAAVEHAAPIAPYPITPYPISDDAMRLWGEIDSLGLAAHIGELEIKGFTVVPPEKVAPPSVAERMLQALLGTASRRHGVEVTADMDPEATPEAMKSPFGLSMVYGLFEDPVFEEALLNPVVQALAAYLLGRNAVVSEFGLLLKGPGGSDLDLHADSFLMPDPLPAMPHVCNITWILTDYSLENGSIAFVPGSHRYRRRPLVNEGLAERVPVEAKAGSLIVFGGNVWHGAFPRTAPGFRASATMYLCRAHMLTQGRYGYDVPAARLEGRSPQFSKMIGRRLNYGWQEEGPREITADVFETINMGTHPWD
jgi:hypothetical protein